MNLTPYQILGVRDIAHSSTSFFMEDVIVCKHTHIQPYYQQAPHIYMKLNVYCVCKYMSRILFCPLEYGGTC